MSMALSSNLICRIAFGKKYDEGNGSEMRSFDELLHEAQAMFAAFFVSDYFPMFGWIDKITGLINRLDKTFENLDSFYQEIIDERLLDPTRAKKKEEDYDILDILIQLKEEKSSSIDLKWDNIKAVLTDIFIAATDTSAAATVWTMTALMKAPNNVMQKVQSEIRNSVGEKGRVDEDDLPKLPYLKAVINETFRLYPPAPLLVPRQTIERCIIEGYEIQPKTLVYINAWAIARDPDYWENPFEFLPERFLNSNIDITQVHPQQQPCHSSNSSIHSCNSANVVDLANRLNTVTLQQPTESQWFMDSGATSHMAPHSGSSESSRDFQVQ
ncbi:hypothetical protein ACP275_07G112900 [Erythranthe tilingii]